MVTKSEIARVAGVSRTCVSLVLNDRPGVRVAAATRRRILETARRLGYQHRAEGASVGEDASSAASHAPAIRPASAIAYVLGTGGQFPSRMAWHFGVLDEVHQCVADDDRCALFASTTDAAASITKLLRTLDRAQPLGVILDGIVPEPLVEAMRQRDLPFVVTGITPYALDPAWRGKVNTVCVDVQEGVQRLMRWLAEHAGRSIAFACEELHLPVSRLILQTYQDVVRELDLVSDPALVQVCSGDTDGRRLLSRLDELNIHYDGLLIGSMPLARTLLDVSPASDVRSGSRPPLVAAIGPGAADEPAPPDVASAYVRPADYARLAYDLLVQQIKYPRRKPQHLHLPLIFRDPTRAYAP